MHTAQLTYAEATAAMINLVFKMEYNIEIDCAIFSRSSRRNFKDRYRVGNNK